MKMVNMGKFLVTKNQLILSHFLLNWNRISIFAFDTIFEIGGKLSWTELLHSDWILTTDSYLLYVVWLENHEMQADFPLLKIL